MLAGNADALAAMCADIEASRAWAMAEVEVERLGGDAAGLPVIGGRNALCIAFTCAVGQLFWPGSTPMTRVPAHCLARGSVTGCLRHFRPRIVSGYIVYNLYCATLPILAALLPHTVPIFVSFRRLQVRIG